MQQLDEVENPLQNGQVSVKGRETKWPKSVIWGKWGIWQIFDENRIFLDIQADGLTDFVPRNLDSWKPYPGLLSRAKITANGGVLGKNTRLKNDDKVIFHDGDINSDASLALWPKS